MKYVAVASSLVLLAILGSGCQAKQPAATPAAPPAPPEGLAKPETVHFRTADGWDVAATYWSAGAGRPAAILLHMLPADRHSYDDLGSALAAAGFNVLALDSRGHGESLDHNGAPSRYTEFDDAAYASSVGDIAAAKDFLAGKDCDVARLVLVGASIGANLALDYAVGDAAVKGVVLLSPGLDYHGVKTEAAMSAYGTRPVYLAASDEDGYAAESVTKLRALAPGADYKMFTDAGHGTNIFVAEPAFRDTVVAWLAARVK